MNTRDRLICFRNTGNIEDIVGVTNSSVKDIEITHSNNGELHNIYIELDKNIDISTGYGKYSNIVLNTKGYRLKTPDKENESEIRGMKDVDESEKGLWDSFVKENGMLEWEDYTEHFIDSFGDFNDRLIVRKQADWDKIITKLLNGDTFENKVIQLECDVKHTYYNSDNFLNSEFAGILDGRMHKIKAKIVKGGRKEPDEEGTPNNENEQDIDRGDRAGFVNRLTGCVYNTYIEVDSDALKGIVYGVCIENSGEIENVSIK